MTFAGKSLTKAGSRNAKFSWAKVDRRDTDECWPWKGALGTWGYGQCSLDGRSVNASRAAYAAANDGIEAGLVVCHSCDNPACCNPSHLFAATQAENLADCRAKGRQVYKTGVSHHRATAKLTEEMVAEARRLYADGVSQSEIGRRWGIHSSTISRAVRGEFWSHVA